MEPTRLYLQTNSDVFSRLLWFHNNKPNEMLLGIYGLYQKQPTLTLEFPEYTLADDELDEVRFNYSEVIEINKQLEHITCHCDGKFHLRTVNDPNDRYIHELKSNIPLGPEVPIFLQFVILSDIASNYRLASKKPKNHHVSIKLADDQCLAMRGAFSGIKFKLAEEMRQTLCAIFKGRPFMEPGVILCSNSLQGIFFWEVFKITEEAKGRRPPGTIVSFMFSTIENKNLIKTFIFQ